VPGARQDRRKASRRKAGNGGRIRERLINTRSWYRTYLLWEGNGNSEGSRSALVTEGEIGCGVCVAVPQQTTDHPPCAPLACFAVHFDYIARLCFKPGVARQTEPLNEVQRQRHILVVKIGTAPLAPLKVLRRERVEQKRSPTIQDLT